MSRGATPWRSDVENAPKDGDPVLLWFDPGEGEYGIADLAYWDDKGGPNDTAAWVINCECRSSCSRPQGFYTHWFRPEPPEGKR